MEARHGEGGVMTTQLNPYLSFRGTAREAMSFYQSVFGGELTTSTFGEMDAGVEPAERDLVMHAQLVSPNGLVLMGADVPAHMDYAPGTNSYSVSLSGADQGELTGYWEKLSVGADVTAPLNQAPWGDTFGMCTDRFGVTWLVNIAGSGDAPAS
jgi:PhnB protein